MTGLAGNTEFCFALPRGTLRVSGKQNSLFPFGQVILSALVLLQFETG